MQHRKQRLLKTEDLNPNGAQKVLDPVRRLSFLNPEEAQNFRRGLPIAGQKIYDTFHPGEQIAIAQQVATQKRAMQNPDIRSEIEKVKDDLNGPLAPYDSALRLGRRLRIDGHGWVCVKKRAGISL